MFDDQTGKLHEYRHLLKHDRYKEIWNKSFANKLGRLAQGIQTIEGTDTIFFFPKDKIPKDKKISYGCIFVT